MFLAVTADENHWDKSQPILFLSDGCKLHDARTILHNAPESAAEWIDKVYDEPTDWWQPDEVQAIRKRVIANYGYGTLRWKQERVTTLLDEYETAKSLKHTTQIQEPEKTE